jgi:hypothetical protein
MYAAFVGAARGPLAKREYANKVPIIPTRSLAAMTERSVLVRGVQPFAISAHWLLSKLFSQARYPDRGPRE